MALLSLALRLVVGLASPTWEASAPRFSALAFFYLPALVVGGYVSARYLAPRSMVVAMVGGFAFMSLVWWSRGARPWWYAAAAGGLFAAFAGGGAILARWPQRAT